MKSITFRTLLILGLAAPAFAGSPIPDEGKASIAKPAVPCASKDRGNLEDLAERLKALTEPMEQKVDDCDGEVAKAKELLASLEISLANETTLARKTHKEIVLLKGALETRGCEIDLGGCKFRREVVAEGLEKRLNQYHKSVASVKELRNSVAAAKEAVQAAIAKLERWQAKEKELLQSVELLQQDHDELFGEENAEKLEKAAQVEAEVESMLGIKDSRDASEPIEEIVADEVDADETSVDESEVTVAETSESAEDSENADATDVKAEKKVPATPVSQSIEVDAEIDVDIEVDTEVEADGEIDLEVLDEVFEKR